jgi:hypothetical protein
MMAREPTYPEAARVGDEESPAAEAVEAAKADKAAESRRTRQIVTGAAIGVGSAALVAALLYANRSRKSGRDDGE